MRAISFGSQGFDEIREHNDFLVDKTSFIKEWWENRKTVTLITRPRRFGKTLNMQMLECFFSNRYAGRSDLFEGLDIWKEERYRQLQGTYPVIFLSFADVKGNTYQDTREAIIGVLEDVFQGYKDLWADDSEDEKKRYSFMDIDSDSSDADIARTLKRLSDYLKYRFNKKVLIFLDEYDTPLQNAYLNGFWNEMSGFIGSLFNSTFKTNPSMERAIMTGITRVSKESVFSELNNLDVITTTSRKYETAFGFTEEEVFAALKEYDLTDERQNVKDWYDGFTFGNRTDIYNPWSIANFLDKRQLSTYWADTSSNGLIGSLVAGNAAIQTAMEDLMAGGTVETPMHEDVVFSDLNGSSEAIWSLFVASGYLKVVSTRQSTEWDSLDDRVYTLKITNGEVRRMFAGLIRRWFASDEESNDGFIRAMLSGDVDSMNDYMNRIALNTISYFDTGEAASEDATPERFYHGFVLGLLVRENRRYQIRSNRESGFGRYDVCMYPKQAGLPGIVMEFKVLNRRHGEKDLNDTADSAISQILTRDYAAGLRLAGVSRILQYGFAFSGKTVLIREA